MRPSLRTPSYLAVPAAGVPESLIALGLIAVAGMGLLFCLFGLLSYLKGQRDRDRYPGIRPPPDA